MPRPRSSRATRIVVPAVVAIGVLAVGAYAAWQAFRPLPDVWVMPVISRPTMRLAGGGAGARSETGSPPGPSGQTVPGIPAPEGAVLAVAPAWVEPDPFAVTVSALTAGVVKEVLALEGQRVEKGDVVVRLDPTDAEMVVRRTEAERDAARAQEAGAAAALRSAEARKSEIEEEIALKRTPAETGAGQAHSGEPVNLEQRRRLAEDAAVQAHAMLAKARAELSAREVVVEQAALDLSRREVRAPVSGVVMSRMVEPGTHVGMSMGMAAEGGGGGGGMPGMRMEKSGGGGGGRMEDMTVAVVRLFDPARLQARTEVGVADSMKIVVGMAAQMTSDAAPDVAFRGTVSRIVPAVDPQKNTVDVKVAIENSEGLLRPGMQMRVKFLGAAPPAPAPSDQASPAAAGSAEGVPGAGRVLVPARGLRDFNGNRARLLVVGAEASRGVARVAARDVTTVGDPELGYVEVTGAVSPGDRVVVRASSNVEPGDRVHVIGEMTVPRN